jgi:hypothetical protein
MKINIYLICILTSIGAFAQTAEERQNIRGNLNTTLLNTLQSTFQNRFEKNEIDIEEYLNKNPSIQRSFVRNGSVFYLKRLDSKGNPFSLTLRTKNLER